MFKKVWFLAVCQRVTTHLCKLLVPTKNCSINYWIILVWNSVNKLPPSKKLKVDQITEFGKQKEKPQMNHSKVGHLPNITVHPNRRGDLPKGECDAFDVIRFATTRGPTESELNVSERINRILWQGEQVHTCLWNRHRSKC